MTSTFSSQLIFKSIFKNPPLKRRETPSLTMAKGNLILLLDREKGDAEVLCRFFCFKYFFLCDNMNKAMLDTENKHGYETKQHGDQYSSTFSSS